MSEGIDDFLVGGNHPFTHLAAQLALQFGMVHHSSHKVHHPGGPPLLLGEVVLAMALEELVVGAPQLRALCIQGVVYYTLACAAVYVENFVGRKPGQGILARSGPASTQTD